MWPSHHICYAERTEWAQAANKAQLGEHAFIERLLAQVTGKADMPGNDCFRLSLTSAESYAGEALPFPLDGVTAEFCADVHRVRVFHYFHQNQASRGIFGM